MVKFGFAGEFIGEGAVSGVNGGGDFAAASGAGPDGGGEVGVVVNLPVSVGLSVAFRVGIGGAG
ncbi:hypothetical protein A3A34_00420 [Candidatus Kaiserbacteria bacterium RIFCSPLOWO2_01_FULL_50_24]|uniref:Uncharacterized protein n=1 Tax=Candidatus Kaiserbacteria bacterium RIFCSPLOWO2_01_FULL_50_24 TaxID=1798507 RepID=A0A1F6EMH5_9BACT|nr:MAG: hypothetical protein A3A34_00420 [Candidatus Kaiserbacteria bacterium RIFCSPLOWO2_01_FULL_50_24]